MDFEGTYQHLLEEWPAVAAESKVEPTFLVERHLQVMWLEQRYFNQLTTMSGQTIEVVSPGIWNAEAGPDFLKAHLRINGEDHFGDVEVHLIDSAWYHHGHHNDPRYDEVILHVALWKPTKEAMILKNNGEEVDRVYLEPNLTIPIKRIIQLIDLDLYPYRKFVGSGRCAQTLFRSMKEERIEEIFSSAAYWRLEKKREFLEARVEAGELRLSAGMAMALGYKANAVVFLKIFLWLQQFKLASVDDLMALAMGASGFMEAAYQEKWQHSAEYCKLLALWKVREFGIPKRFHVIVGQARPFNHPVRRLAVLCHLVAETVQWQSYSDIWVSHWRGCTGSRHLMELRSDLIHSVPAIEDSYWNSHYLFEESSKPEFIPLVGQELRQQVVINTILPLLFHEVNERREVKEVQAFDALYRSFRAPQSGKRSYLYHRFFGESPKGQVLGHSLFEQGAFQIHRDFCVHFEASCEGCPFVERVDRLRT